MSKKRTRIMDAGKITDANANHFFVKCDVGCRYCGRRLFDGKGMRIACKKHKDYYWSCEKCESIPPCVGDIP